MNEKLHIYVPTVLQLYSDVDINTNDVVLPEYNYSINDFSSEYPILYCDVLKSCLHYKYENGKVRFKLVNSNIQSLISSINLVNHFSTLELNKEDLKNSNNHNVIGYPNGIKSPYPSMLNFPQHYIAYLSSLLFNNPETTEPFINLHQIEKQIIDGIKCDESYFTLGEQLAEQFEPCENDYVLRYIFEQLIEKKREIYNDDDDDEWHSFPFNKNDIITFDVKIMGTLHFSNFYADKKLRGLNDFFKNNLDNISPYIINITNSTTQYHLTPIIWRISLKLGENQNIIDIPHFRITEKINDFIDSFQMLTHAHTYAQTHAPTPLNDALYKKINDIIHSFIIHDGINKQINIHKTYELFELINNIKQYCCVLLEALDNIKHQSISNTDSILDATFLDTCKHLAVIFTISANITCSENNKVLAIIKFISYILYNLCKTLVVVITNHEMTDDLEIIINRFNQDYGLLYIINLIGALFKNILFENFELHIKDDYYKGFPDYIILSRKIDTLLHNMPKFKPISWKYFCERNYDVIKILLDLFVLNHFDFIELLIRMPNVDDKLFIIKMIEYGGIIKKNSIILTHLIDDISLGITNYVNQIINKHYNCNLVKDIIVTDLKELIFQTKYKIII